MRRVEDRFRASFDGVSAHGVGVKKREFGTALHRAAQRGLVDCVKLLLDRGAAVDARPDFETPLHFAVKSILEKKRTSPPTASWLLLSK